MSQTGDLLSGITLPATMPTPRLSEPHFERPTHLLEIWEHAGWLMKVYGVSYRRERPRPELVQAAKEVARSRLPQPPAADGRYGVGFLVIHDGRGGNWVCVDWWTNENELVHHLYESADDAPLDFRYVTPTGLMACVHEMAVLVAERRAWIDEVLANRNGPDLRAYLGRGVG